MEETLRIFMKIEKGYTISTSFISTSRPQTDVLVSQSSATVGFSYLFHRFILSCPQNIAKTLGIFEKSFPP